MQQALWAALFTGTACALLSGFLVLKGWAMMGDAVSHAILPGIVIATLLGAPPLLGAFLSGLSCTLLTGIVQKNRRFKEDTALGIVFSTLFAAGLLLFHHSNSGQHLNHILFGSLLGIEPAVFRQTAVITTLVSLILLIKRRDFTLYLFDPQQARISGLSVPLLHNGLLILLALTAVAAIAAVGVVLVVAMLVAPGISAQLLCRRFSTLMPLSVLFANLSTVCGLLLSYHLGVAGGAAIVLCQAALFLLALSLHQRQQRNKRKKAGTVKRNRQRNSPKNKQGRILIKNLPTKSASIVKILHIKRFK